MPGFYTREHLGLILGITRELAASVRAFVPLSIAAVPDRLPKGLLLHLDLHLQRFEITRLKREGQLSREESISAEGTGLGILHRRWVDAIAEEFVRHTRFDPLHQAASEQELYDRLPGILAQLNQDPSVHFEMTGGSKVYHVTLTADLFKKTATPVLEEIRRLIVRFCDRYGQNDPDRILLVTDRLAGLPGIKKMLNGIENCKVVALPIGSGAMGSLRFQEPSGAAGTAGGAPFLTTRSLPVEATIPIETHRQEDAGPQRPTHILYRNLAYPIAKRPLIIGIAPEQGATAIQIRGQVAGVSRKHCSIQQRGDDVILEDHSTYGTYVNEKPVTGKAKLALGQIIRVGTPGEKLKLIACLGTPIEET